MVGRDLAGRPARPAAAMLAAAPVPQARTRLVLRHPSRIDGWVDGGWWPYSLDLVAELPSLIQALDRAGFDTEDVTYHLPAWSPVKDDVLVNGRHIRLGGYRSQEPDSITLAGPCGDRLDLLVIAPDTNSRVADRALLFAGGADRHTPHEILQHAHTAPVANNQDRAASCPTDRPTPHLMIVDSH